MERLQPTPRKCRCGILKLGVTHEPPARATLFFLLVHDCPRPCDTEQSRAWPFLRDNTRRITVHAD